VTTGGLTDRLLADYPNMYGDLSAGSGLNALTRDEVHAREFLARHQDKLLYGSDWPNSDQWLPFEVELRLVREYFASKGRTVAEKYFWKNSVAAYRWVKRDATQPGG